MEMDSSIVEKLAHTHYHSLIHSDRTDQQSRILEIPVWTGFPTAAAATHKCIAVGTIQPIMHVPCFILMMCLGIQSQRASSTK